MRYIGVGRSDAPHPAKAVAEATAGLDLSGACFLIVFTPQRLCLQETLTELEDVTRGVPVFGCTSAGQITPRGYETDALLVLAFPRAHFRCASILFENLYPFSAASIAEQAGRLSNTFRHAAGWDRLGLIFTDGLSKQEDMLVSTLEAVLDGTPVFGGSAGDGLLFRQTYVIHRGRAVTNAAVLLLIETNLFFKGLAFDHFLPRDVQLVITGAEPDDRLVHEINGAPAAMEYARLVGCTVDMLSPRIFAENPLLVEHGGRHYVRAISAVRDGHALSFLAAIDDGLVMSLGTGQDMLESMRAALPVEGRWDDQPDFILGFDCVLRRIALGQTEQRSSVSDLLIEHGVLGFNTYGEQSSGVHMNQTFLGVAFFEPEHRPLA